MSWEAKEIHAKMLIGNPEAKRALRKSSHRWKDKIDITGRG
jgi:hypothetical protein